MGDYTITWYTLTCTIISHLVDGVASSQKVSVTLKIDIFVHNKYVYSQEGYVCV